MAKEKEEIRDGEKIHFSVGALIERDGKFLLIDRAIPPFGFAGIAGHIDAGESPEEALRREIKEECGLDLGKYEPIFEEFVAWDECSRGVRGHYWYLYRCEVSGDIKFNARETKKIGWFPLEEIGRLTLEPVWKYWFEKLGMV